MKSEYASGFDRSKPKDLYEHQLGRLIDEEDPLVAQGKYDYALNRIQTYNTDPAEMRKQVDALIGSIDRNLSRIQKSQGEVTANNYLGFKNKLLEIRPKE